MSGCMWTRSGSTSSEMAKGCTCTLLRTLQVKNKRYITKLMFLAVVARPRKFSNRVLFNGKIGICPIVDTKIAQRSSKHLPKGTKVLVPATVDGESYKKLMIEGVIPAIKIHMPRPEGHTTFIAGQGKVMHQGEIMEAIEEAVGDDIAIGTQPAK
ncbi:unnamed protein product [Choristocarpus tenellus]